MSRPAPVAVPLPHRCPSCDAAVLETLKAGNGRILLDDHRERGHLTAGPWLVGRDGLARAHPRGHRVGLPEHSCR